SGTRSTSRSRRRPPISRRHRRGRRARNRLPRMPSYFITISDGDMKAAEAALDTEGLMPDSEPGDELVSVIVTLDADDADDAVAQVREVLPENRYTLEDREKP